MTAKPLKKPTLVTDPLIGQQLGDYSIVSLLGRGGMARVYKGFDPKLERYAAVKVIDAHLAAGSDAPEYRERFHREARSIARLRHPNIVSVYQFGEFSNLYYMAMMFIEGYDLTHVLRDHASRRARMTFGAVLRVARDIGAALDYAHREGVIHRDIKPSNIMVMNDGHAILTDFGLALSVPEGSIGNTFGSAHYIAPEQAVASNNAVPQSDLYSLAVVIYQMLAGRVPFDDPSAMSVAIKHLQDPPPPPSLINHELTADVDSVLLKALQKQPEKRYPSGAALANALEKALKGTGKSILFTDEALRVTVAEDPDSTLRRDSATIPLPPSQKSSSEALHVAASAAASSPKPEIKPLSQARPAVVPVWAQDLTGEMGSLPRLPTSKPRRRPLMVAAAIAIIALLGLGLALLPGLRAISPDATAPMLAQGITETSGASAPTSTAVEEPVTRPTTLPTATRITVTAATTRLTSAPSATPAGSALSASLDLRLTYDGEVVTLVNVGSRRIDLTGIEFAQSLDDGSERLFRATQWGSSGFSVARFDPGDCVQVWTDAYVSRGAPAGCVRQAWRAVSRPRWFWIATGTVKDFVVREGGIILATCDIADGSCDIAVE